MTRGIKDYEMVNCKNCGKEKEMPKFRHSQFCSHKCANDFSKGGRFIKGQSYEERFGIEKAKEMRELNSISAKKTMYLRPNFSMKGRKHSKKTKIKMGNPIYNKKRLSRRPMSSLEIKMNNILQCNNLPYKFVGNGEFFIERKCPDFVNCNGEKKAIEVYYKRHKEIFGQAKTIGIKKWKQERSEIFAKYGWEVLYFDETEVNEQNVLSVLKGDEKW